MDFDLGVKFWGVRGSVPVSGPQYARYGGSTSCVQIKTNSSVELIMDGGSGLYQLGQNYLKQAVPDEVHLFLTHPHWDHIQGLPFFVPAYIPKKKINIYGCSQGALELRTILDGQMSNPYFPVELDTWQADIDIITLRETELDLGDIKVTTAYAQHPGLTLGYKIEKNGKSVVYYSDNEIFGNYPVNKVLACLESNDFDEEDLQAVMLAEEKKKLFKMIAGVDVLIHDAQYTNKEYEAKLGWGHSTVELLTRCAIAAKVKHLVLFHHDPSDDDDHVDEKVALAREIAKDCSDTQIIISAASQFSEMIEV